MTAACPICLAANKKSLAAVFVIYTIAKSKMLKQVQHDDMVDNVTHTDDQLSDTPLNPLSVTEPLR